MTNNTSTNLQTALGFNGADAAMLRAAEQARRIALQTGTPLAIWKDGQVVRIPATTAVMHSMPKQQPTLLP